MTNAKLIEILEAAIYHLNKSIYWYDLSQGDEESMQWEFSRIHDDIAMGILEAYNILTGTKINANIISIRAELACIKAYA